jgi:hypothetical protein
LPSRPRNKTSILPKTKKGKLARFPFFCLKYPLQRVHFFSR